MTCTPLDRPESLPAAMMAWQPHYHETCERVRGAAAPALLAINETFQRALLIKEGEPRFSYTVSTSTKGIGQREGSGQTPLGLHEVCEKIGEGAPLMGIFKSRVLVEGEEAKLDTVPGVITTRILRLRGLEAGVNLGRQEDGTCVDSFERYIYVHGTNRISDLGTRISQGCINMHPEDIVQLYPHMDLGSHVFIYTS